MTDRLSFSVIIPTRNRHVSLNSCLQSLTQQSFPESDFEVIVVDDGSAPPVQDSIRAEFPQIDISLIRVSQNLGPAAARNRGAECARSRYLAFLDDDCLADAHWLAELKCVLTTAACSAVGGRVLDGGGNLYSAASHAILDAAYEYYNASTGNPRFFACLNLAIPAKEYRQVGGFLPEFRISEDREFCARWLRHGYSLIFAPEAIVVHQPRLRLGSFLSRHYNYGRGAYRFRALEAKACKRRVKLEPPTFYWQLIGHPLWKQPGTWGIGISFLAAVSQIASLAGFLEERRRAKRANQ